MSAPETRMVKQGSNKGTRYDANRARVVDENFVAAVKEFAHEARGAASVDDDAPLEPDCTLTGAVAKKLFESQVVARHQDIESRLMRGRDEGFYTIASAGHEGNVVLGRLSRHTDLAFLHYRSGAFMAERARQVPGIDFIRDAMLSFAASADEPIAGGRHKVWGSVELHVPPQTSTIASHLPKSVGAALSLRRAARLGVANDIPSDAIVICSFGDASVNHAVAQTAFNAAAWSAYQRIPVPLLFVCEDNNTGISVPTPAGWIEASMSSRPAITYFHANGLDLIDAYRVAQRAIEHCRRSKGPTFLHLDTVRMLGHAGSDVETEYRTWDQIEASEAMDPVLATARLLLSRGIMSASDVLDLYESVRQRVQVAARDAAKTAKLSSAAQIMEPLVRYAPDAVAKEASRVPPHAARVEVFGGEKALPEHGPARHMAALIDQGLHDLLAKYPEAILFGEDVAKKGGVYHVTAGLASKFGAGRVFNTLLDETTILGMGIGAAHVGLLPIPEIQYLAYYHNAQDQIRAEACSLQFFSNDQFRNPMVMRIAGWAYQKGFGGHFHNDNSIAALRDVPGLVIATPSRGDDAVKMMRTCMALAKVDGRVTAFIEPIARYMTKHLHEDKDQAWSFPYPPPNEFIPLGHGHVYDEDAKDMTVLTFANGVYMSLRAAKTLREEHDIAVRVVDLRWLSPLNEAFIREQAGATGCVLVVDEGRKSGGVSEAILALLGECGSAAGSGPASGSGGAGGSGPASGRRSDLRTARLTAHDTYIPLGPAADLVLPTEEDIVSACLALYKKA